MASTIRTMIVDDEDRARDELKYLLEKYPDLYIVSQARTCQEALKDMERHHPHLVFLDIEMPGMSGVSVAEKMTKSEMPPLIVFATAHEEFAAKAFEIDAVDYLLKPFSTNRVAHCVARVRTLLNQSLAVSSSQRMPVNVLPRKQKLAIENNGKTTIIDISDVIMACSADGQIAIYTKDKIYHCNMTLHDLQSKLEQHSFFRSHRAYLVNVDKIREIIPWFNGTYNLIVDGLSGMEVPVSRQQAGSLKKYFDL